MAVPLAPAAAPNGLAAPVAGRAGGDQPVIETRGLRKTYGKFVALHGLDLVVPRASVGLLGANGAGKTTLLRLLLGLARSDAGGARVLGLDAWADAIAVRSRVGYMPESDSLPPGTTAADFVGHMAEMSGLPARAARQRAADVLYQVGLDEERYRLIKGFSTGMKQRVKLAQAIVHDPDLVFLDEPTNGMDPQGREEMLDLVVRIHQVMGIAVVMSSHILEDIERVCDHVVILDHGRLVVSRPIRGLEGDDGRAELLVRIDGDPAPFVARLAAGGLAVRRNATDDPWEELVVAHNDDRAYDLIRDAAADLGVPLRSLRARSSSLEEVYLREIGPDGVAERADLAGGAPVGGGRGNGRTPAAGRRGRRDR